MRLFSLIFPIALAWFTFAHAPKPQPKPPDPVTLETVLKRMDATAASFRSAQADFEWDNYEKVIDEVDDVETGSIFYRKTGQGIEMMAEVKKAGATLAAQKPEPKFVLFNGSKIQMYQPKPDQVTEYDVNKNNRATIESYLVLGFGGSGQDLQKAFDVTFSGQEAVNGVPTAKLLLVPKSQRMLTAYKQIVLWIDLDRGVSVQQQFFQPQGNYRLAKYSSVQINGKKIPDDVFKLHTTGKTQTITPKG